ncbi:MAG TPA: hypothetical protein VEW90_02470 [Gaiellaceae bacterium]|nr:hypothetical protein [Gaiellaceae bacterium]
MSDTRLVGIALLLVAPLLVATGYMSARGGYASGSFWRSTRDEKLDRIIDAREYWLWMHATWVVLLLVLAGGMTGVGFVLAGAGEPALAGIGIGLSLISIACWLVGVVLQGPPAAIAAELRHETGHTPGWLAPLFTVVGWTELAYVAGTAAAYVVLGAAMVGSGEPSGWAGWVSIVFGGVTILATVLARHAATFPELPLVVPVVLGVAFVLA